MIKEKKPEIALGFFKKILKSKKKTIFMLVNKQK